MKVVEKLYSMQNKIFTSISFMIEYMKSYIFLLSAYRIEKKRQVSSRYA